MKNTSCAIAVAAVLTIGGGLSSVPASAQLTTAANTTQEVETIRAAASATDMSARHTHRRYRVVRSGAPYAYYYRPRPIYYRPATYYAPVSFLPIGFGPRQFW